PRAARRARAPVERRADAEVLRDPGRADRAARRRRSLGGHGRALPIRSRRGPSPPHPPRRARPPPPPPERRPGAAGPAAGGPPAARQPRVARPRRRPLPRSGAQADPDLDETVDEPCRNAGEIELVFRAPRRNDVRLLLLMDVGGTMDPHFEPVSQLLTALHE